MYLNCQELVQFHHLSYKLKKNLQLFIRPFHRVPLVGAFFAFNFLQWTSNQPLIEKTLSDVSSTIADFSKLFSSDIISQFEHKSNHCTLDIIVVATNLCSRPQKRESRLRSIFCDIRRLLLLLAKLVKGTKYGGRGGVSARISNLWFSRQITCISNISRAQPWPCSPCRPSVPLSYWPRLPFVCTLCTQLTLQCSRLATVALGLCSQPISCFCVQTVELSTSNELKFIVLKINCFVI